MLPASLTFKLCLLLYALLLECYLLVEPLLERVNMVLNFLSLTVDKLVGRYSFSGSNNDNCDLAV